MTEDYEDFPHAAWGEGLTFGEALGMLEDRRQQLEAIRDDIAAMRLAWEAERARHLRRLQRLGNTLWGLLEVFLVGLWVYACLHYAQTHHWWYLLGCAVYAALLTYTWRLRPWRQTP